jgi:hypothetical protein
VCVCVCVCVCVLVYLNRRAGIAHVAVYYMAIACSMLSTLWARTSLSSASILLPEICLGLIDEGQTSCTREGHTEGETHVFSTLRS